LIRWEATRSLSHRANNKPLFNYASFDTNVGHFDLGGREYGGNHFDRSDHCAVGALSRMAWQAARAANAKLEQQSDF
jgi:hypothetical protein